MVYNKMKVDGAMECRVYKASSKSTKGKVRVRLVHYERVKLYNILKP